MSAPDRLRGSITPLVTPFKDNEVDYARYEQLVHFQINNGAHGILVNGTTSEPATLTLQERQNLLGVAVRANDAAWFSRGPGTIPREIWPRITLNPHDYENAPAGKVMTFAMTPLSISSTAIRDSAAAGASIRYLTPDAVAEFIRSHNLYT